jgi:2,4-dienoyl-CoA reductase (NADPH2)
MKRMRVAFGEGFIIIIIYRLSILHLVDDGSSWGEVVELALDMEVAVAPIIDTGIGWHEAREYPPSPPLCLEERFLGSRRR